MLAVVNMIAALLKRRRDGPMWVAPVYVAGSEYYLSVDLRFFTAFAVPSAQLGGRTEAPT